MLADRPFPTSRSQGVTRRAIGLSVHINASKFSAAPVYGQEVVLGADIYLSDTIRGKYNLDVVGHYVPPDVLGSHLDTRKQTPVRLGEECKSHARDE